MRILDHPRTHPCGACLTGGRGTGLGPAAVPDSSVLHTGIRLNTEKQVSNHTRLLSTATSDAVLFAALRVWRVLKWFAVSKTVISVCPCSAAR